MAPIPLPIGSESPLLGEKSLKVDNPKIVTKCPSWNYDQWIWLRPGLPQHAVVVSSTERSCAGRDACQALNGPVMGVQVHMLYPSILCSRTKVSNGGGSELINGLLPATYFFPPGLARFGSVTWILLREYSRFSFLPFDLSSSRAYHSCHHPHRVASVVAANSSMALSNSF